MTSFSLQPNRVTRRLTAFVLVLLTIEFLDELVFGLEQAALPLIRDELQLTYTQIGLLFTVPSLLGAITEPFVGVLGDTRWRRSISLGGGVGFAVACALTSQAFSFEIHERFLPGINLPPSLIGESDAAKAVAGAELVVVASVSKGFRSATKCLGHFSGIVVSVTKGIELETGKTMTDILAENAPKSRVVAMSGPTLATEVAKGIPTAIVAASTDAKAAQTVQALFHDPAFRVYTSDDVHGVELGGALKNVIAIGAGVCDGLGFGDNSKAALVTRAIRRSVSSRHNSTTC